jgi:hypothetical protein
MADDITDKLAHHRLDSHEKEIAKHDAHLGKLADTLVQLDKNSEVRHQLSQSQNDAILARLNQPSVVMAILGDPVKIGGIVTLLGALLSGAVALGYAQAPEARPVLVPHFVEPAHDPSGLDPVEPAFEPAP